GHGQVGIAVRADDDHRDLAQPEVVLALAEDVPAGEDGHHQIEDHDVRPFGAHDLQRIAAVRRLEELVMVALEGGHDHPADAGVVIDDQHAEWPHGHDCLTLHDTQWALSRAPIITVPRAAEAFPSRCRYHLARMKIAVAMSGGVDSSTAAYLL